MDTVYQQQIYSGWSTRDIKAAIIREGFDPIHIKNTPGATYPLHAHAETKLLVFISGDMEVFVGEKMYQCAKGDRLMIKSNVPHRAKVGKKGCTFFWSEKMLDF